MKQFRITSEMFRTDTINDCYIGPSDPIFHLIKNNSDNDRFINRIKDSIAAQQEENNENK